MKREPIAGLDVLRFFAALLVMISHLGFVSWTGIDIGARIVAATTSYPELYYSYGGFVGVQIFFVLSGIVISFSASVASTTSFLRSRVLRLYPAVWICVPISIFIVWFYGMENDRWLAAAFIKSLILWPFGGWVEPVYWTLGVEMSFYALVVCLLLFFSSKHLMNVGYFVGGISAAYWFVLWWTGAAWEFHRGTELLLVYQGIYFAFGILLYSISTTGVSPTRIVFGQILLAAAAIEIFYKVKAESMKTHLPMQAWGAILVFLIAMFFAIVSMYWNASPQTARILRIVGLATYPLYLIHDYLGAAVLRITGGFLNKFVALGFAMTVCISVSLFISTLLEPFIRRGLASILRMRLR